MYDELPTTNDFIYHLPSARYPTSVAVRYILNNTHCGPRQGKADDGQSGWLVGLMVA